MEGRSVITLQCKLEFENRRDREKVLSLMRRFSSACRYAYKRLLEGRNRNNLKREIPLTFGINTRYADDAVLLAQSLLSSCRKRKQNPEKLIFGGRKLFEKLRSYHLSKARKRAYRREWREKRQGNLYSRGDKSKKGNLNLRFVFEKEGMSLRINTGSREYVYAKVIRGARRERDRWIDFCWNLLIAENNGRYFPYSVELKLREGELYAFVSCEEFLPKKEITIDWGAIGIDVNASPFHVAWSEVDEEGKLKSYGRIELSELIGKSKRRRQNLLWEIAHRIVEIAKSRGRAIAMENLKKLPKGRRGDGRGKLRRRFQHFIYRGILEKVEILAKREGIEVKKVFPAYTSVVGALKYSPQYLIDKDVAGAYVIGRRGMGFQERLPKHYERLLSDEEALLYSLGVLEERIEELKTKVKEEGNRWKKKALRRELRKLREEKKAIVSQLKSLECDSATREQASGGNKPVRGLLQGRHKSWRVLRAVLTFSFLGKSFVRDFSPLRRILVCGDWEGVVKGRVPVLGAGTMAGEIAPAEFIPGLNRRNINSSAPSCVNMRFG